MEKTREIQNGVVLSADDDDDDDQGQIDDTGKLFNLLHCSLPRVNIICIYQSTTIAAKTTIIYFLSFIKSRDVIHKKE